MHARINCAYCLGFIYDGVWCLGGGTVRCQTYDRIRGFDSRSKHYQVVTTWMDG